MTTKLRAIVVNEEMNTISFQKVKDMGPYAGKLEQTPEVKAANGGTVHTVEGRVIARGEKSHLLKPGTVWTHNKRAKRKYVFLREGSVAPMVVTSAGVEPMTMTDDEAYLAIQSRQATRFHRGGMSWQLILILLLIMANVVLGIAVVTGG